MDNLNPNINNPASDEPIPFDIGDSPTGKVSHAPLDLGGGPAAPAPKRVPPKVSPAKPAGVMHPVQKTNVRPVSSEDIAASGGRISGVKTFFAKLHAGSLEFLDGQIVDWLREHPEVVVKRTNIATGDVVAKKTEPHILITIWY